MNKINGQTLNLKVKINTYYGVGVQVFFMNGGCTGLWSITENVQRVTTVSRSDDTNRCYMGGQLCLCVCMCYCVMCVFLVHRLQDGATGCQKCLCMYVIIMFLHWYVLLVLWCMSSTLLEYKKCKPNWWSWCKLEKIYYCSNIFFSKRVLWEKRNIEFLMNNEYM